MKHETPAIPISPTETKENFDISETILKPVFAESQMETTQKETFNAFKERLLGSEIMQQILQVFKAQKPDASPEYIKEIMELQVKYAESLINFTQFVFLNMDRVNATQKDDYDQSYNTPVGGDTRRSVVLLCEKVAYQYEKLLVATKNIKNSSNADILKKEMINIVSSGFFTEISEKLAKSSGRERALRNDSAFDDFVRDTHDTVLNYLTEKLESTDAEILVAQGLQEIFGPHTIDNTCYISGGDLDERFKTDCHLFFNSDAMLKILGQHDGELAVEPLYGKNGFPIILNELKKDNLYNPDQPNMLRVQVKAYRGNRAVKETSFGYVVHPGTKQKTFTIFVPPGTHVKEQNAMTLTYSMPSGETATSIRRFREMSGMRNPSAVLISGGLTKNLSDSINLIVSTLKQ